MSLTVQVTGTGVTVSPTATTSVSVASTGIVGPAGAQGVQGTAGIGTQGIQGTNGTQGTQGTAGTGTQGAQGIQGITGTQGTQGTNGTQGIQGTTGTSDWSAIDNKPAGLVSGSSQINGTQIQNNSVNIGNTSISLGNTPTFPFYINGINLVDSAATGSFTGSFKGDGSGLTGIAGTAAFPHTGSAQISGSLTVSGSVLIRHTGIDALKVTATDGIAVVRHDGAFNDPFGSSLGGRIYPGTGTILVNRNGTLATGGGFLGNGSQETFLFMGYNTSTSVGLGTVENNTVIFVSGGLNQTWVGYGDSTKDSKLWVRDYLNIQGQISASGAITGSDLYIDNIGSVSASLASAVSSTTIQNIESMSSASYAAITPISGTLYIIT